MFDESIRNVYASDVYTDYSDEENDITHKDGDRHEIYNNYYNVGSDGKFHLYQCNKRIVVYGLLTSVADSIRNDTKYRDDISGKG